MQAMPTGYIDFIIERVLPVVAEQGLADFCDVFLESSVFNVPQSRKLLLAAQKLGLPSKVHADEIDPLGGSEPCGRDRRNFRRTPYCNAGQRH